MPMRGIWLAALTAMLLVTLAMPLPVNAHETKSSGPYLIKVGWQFEPAYTGTYNGVEVSVTDTRTSQPVGNLAGNLTVTLNIGPSSTNPPIDPSDTIGVYDAHVILTQPGTYNATVKGTIGSTPVNLNFGLDTVADSSDIQFPVKQPSPTTLQGSINDTNNRAMLMGWIGIGLGIAGVALGALALVKTRKR